jgi:hypothetical protein
MPFDAHEHILYTEIERVSDIDLLQEIGRFITQWEIEDENYTKECLARGKQDEYLDRMFDRLQMLENNLTALIVVAKARRIKDVPELPFLG